VRTDPTGSSFLSYRRSRHEEARLLIQAQHDLGIPTWQDIEDLPTGQAETEIRKALDDPGTANGLLWLTPEVEQSAMIRHVEAPGLVRRHQANDGFFLLPVVAGGLTYDDAARVTGPLLDGANLADWNLHLVPSDPVTPEEAAQVAARVLRHRLGVVHSQLPVGQPLQVVVDTFDRPPKRSGHALVLDWTRRFDQPRGRGATTANWERVILPALDQVVGTILATAPGRPVVAGGKLPIPAAIALGVAFLVQRGQQLSWRQNVPRISEQLWGLNATREPSGFSFEIREGAVTGEGLAVLVSVSDDVSNAFGRANAALGTRSPFRGILAVGRPDPPPHRLSAEQAADVANIVAAGLRAARQRHPRIKHVHLFMAAPVGLAVMIGQLLNTFGTVQTYDFVAADPDAPYRPAVVLHPSL
jgi:hypothetical protein